MRTLFCFFLVLSCGATMAQKSFESISKMVSTDETIVFIGGKHVAEASLKSLFPEYKTQNRGLDKITSNDLVTQLDKLMPAAAQKIVLFTLAEDLASKDEIDSKSNMTVIIDAIQSKLPKAKVILVGYFPVSPMMQRKIRSNEPIMKANTTMSRLADSKGVSFCNIFYEMINEEGDLETSFTSDGIYLSDNGYEALKSYLRGFLF